MEAYIPAMAQLATAVADQPRHRRPHHCTVFSLLSISSSSVEGMDLNLWPETWFFLKNPIHVGGKFIWQP
jgi:hypothetical protein